MNEAKQQGDEFRDRLAQNIRDYLAASYPTANVTLFPNTSNSPTIHIDVGGHAKVNITITRARS